MPKNLIRIEPGQGARKGAVKAHETPEQVWLNYYRKHNEKNKIDDLRMKVRVLNSFKKFREVRAMLVGFLTYHGKDAEPWMYSALALAIREGKGNEADVKQAAGYAADVALKSRNPNQLVIVADQLFLLNYLDRAGQLIDLAAELVPHRGEPLLMSMLLAKKTRDPKRMGDAVEALLSMGWPGPSGYDDGVRSDARKQVEALAKSLREEGRDEDADALLARLPAAEARDLFVRLTWVGEADLDLVVEDPLGVTTSPKTPRTVGGGAIVKNGYGKHAEEVFVCPRGFGGEYTIRVDTIANSEEKPAVTATLEVITHEGTPEEHKETFPITLVSKAPEPVKVTLRNGRRTKALPYVAPPGYAGPRPRAVAGKDDAKRPATAAPAAPPATGAGKP